MTGSDKKAKKASAGAGGFFSAIPGAALLGLSSGPAKQVTGFSTIKWKDSVTDKVTDWAAPDSAGNFNLNITENGGGADFSAPPNFK